MFINFLVVIQNVVQNQAKCLVGVGKTTHARHDAENVVVYGVDVKVEREVGKCWSIDGTS
jgi:hypothetical protein